jgi:hypothetical protein
VAKLTLDQARNIVYNRVPAFYEVRQGQLTDDFVFESQNDIFELEIRSASGACDIEFWEGMTIWEIIEQIVRLS